ncbi:ASCH domain-containing protein [Vibrio tritonius]|uniref:ASCH domain-containing protein n=1 Tax=Vibrio tritonius TaxID=1435069 RepID=UPI000837F161|nr:ASCH domain-containing protein [Vibrio tritonius]
MNPEHREFLNQYLATLTISARENIPNVIAEYFCADEENANECARLVNNGIKTATCSFKKGYEAKNEPLPKVGQLMVVLDWEQNPVCIVETTKVSVCAFGDVDSEFARAEGEGDRSYSWWREAHIDFFRDYAQELGCEFNDQSEIVQEWFKKVYPR